MSDGKPPVDHLHTLVRWLLNSLEATLVVFVILAICVLLQAAFSTQINDQMLIVFFVVFMTIALILLSRLKHSEKYNYRRNKLIAFILSNNMPSQETRAPAITEPEAASEPKKSDSTLFFLLAGGGLQAFGSAVAGSSPAFVFFFVPGMFIMLCAIGKDMYDEKTGEPSAFISIPAVQAMAWIVFGIACVVMLFMGGWYAFFFTFAFSAIPLAIWYHNRPEIIRARKEKIAEKQAAERQKIVTERIVQEEANDRQLAERPKEFGQVPAPSAIAEKIADEILRKK